MLVSRVQWLLLKSMLGTCTYNIQLFHASAGIYSYFMLQQAMVQNVFRGGAEGNSLSSRYLHQGENVLH